MNNKITLTDLDLQTMDTLIEYNDHTAVRLYALAMVFKPAGSGRAVTDLKNTYNRISASQKAAGYLTYAARMQRNAADDALTVLLQLYVENWKTVYNKL